MADVRELSRDGESEDLENTARDRDAEAVPS